MQVPNPIIVHVVEQPVKSTTIGDVILGAIGLTGVAVLVALLLGALLGGALIGYKLLRNRRRPVSEDSDAIHISPYLGC